MTTMTHWDATSKNHQWITERVNRTGWLIESTRDEQRHAAQSCPTHGHRNVVVVAAAFLTVALAIWLVSSTPLA